PGRRRSSLHIPGSPDGCGRSSTPPAESSSAGHYGGSLMPSATTGDRISPLRLTLAALLVYAAARVVTTAFVLQASERQVPYLPWTGANGVDLLDMSVLWDGSWYRVIAEEGYPSELPV